MFRVPNEYRLRKHPTYGSTEEDGNNGVFIIPKDGYEIFVIASDGGLDENEKWEHVSVSINRQRCPSWEQMCFIKNLFWEEEDCVLQYHPAKKDYVNMHPYVLHLWRPVGKEIAMPPKVMV